MQFLIHDIKLVFDIDSGILLSFYERYKNELFLKRQKLKIFIMTVFCFK